HDRCMDVPGAKYDAGATLVVWDCSGAANQKFVHRCGAVFQLGCRFSRRYEGRCGGRPAEGAAEG
ncbi:hypothetical protein AB0G82_32965, partial [Streptomyces anulatus]|uniref:RICIN domain-containing protein n=1 Tax=Streptomyces anulatus TaxID=1892 RepID=UPI0033CA95AF